MHVLFHRGHNRVLRALVDGHCIATIKTSKGSWFARDADGNAMCQGDSEEEVRSWLTQYIKEMYIA